jgi:hypothetical protein
MSSHESEHGQGKTTSIIVGNWRPSPGDVLWASQMVKCMKNGAVWTLPESGNAYKIDHAAKTLDLVLGNLDTTFSKNFLCFGQVGYLVRDARSGQPLELELKGKILMLKDGEMPISSNAIVVDTNKNKENEMNNASELSQTFDQLMELFYELKREIKQKDTHLFERWKAGGYTVDPDVLSMYPNLGQVIEKLDEEEEEEEEDEEEEEEEEDEEDED